MRFFLLLTVTITLVTLFEATNTVAATPIQLYGLNYNTRQGPDWDWNKCKSREQVLTDLTLLKRLTNRFRLLSLADCGQGELVLGVAKELGLQLWLGLWVSENENVFLHEKAVLEDMLNRNLLNNDDDTVLGITVGSESIYRKEVNASDIIEYKHQIKGLLLDTHKSNLPVTIVDIAPTYQYNPQLTEAVDVVMTNSFPYWENIDIDDAVDYLLEELNPILSQSQFRSVNKKLILGETGWPSDGAIEGFADGSPELQAKYFENFYCRMDRELGLAYYYFTSIDNSWRQEQDPENTIEGNWGLFYANLTLKPHFQNLVFTCPGSSVEYSFSEIDLSIPQYTAPPTPFNPASCSAHSQCAALNGNCCPTDTGLQLGCCDIITPPAASNAPEEIPVTKSPTDPPPLTLTPTTSVPTKFPSAIPTSTPTREVVTPITPETTELPTSDSNFEINSTLFQSQPPTRLPTTVPATPSPITTVSASTPESVAVAETDPPTRLIVTSSHPTSHMPTLSPTSNSPTTEAPAITTIPQPPTDLFSPIVTPAPTISDAKITSDPTTNELDTTETYNSPPPVYPNELSSTTNGKPVDNATSTNMSSVTLPPESNSIEDFNQGNTNNLLYSSDTTRCQHFSRILLATLCFYAYVLR